VRLLVARCEVRYTGRLTATLPDAVRLLVFKADGSVLVHDDAGGYKPLNCIRREFRPLGDQATDRVAVCTDDARWITGQVIDSEGGFRRWAS
jgi:Endonuclease NucS N-terminal PH-like domain